MNRVKTNIFFILDIIEFMLSVIAIVAFTIVFRLESSVIRYLFLLGDVYVIYSFSKTISSLETKIESRFVKNSNYKIDSNYKKKLSA
jgi:hypothetical protein